MDCGKKVRMAAGGVQKKGGKIKEEIKSVPEHPGQVQGVRAWRQGRRMRIWGSN